MRFSGKTVVVTGAASGIGRAGGEASFVTGTSLVVDGGITMGPRHSWDPAVPGLFETLRAYVESPAPENPPA